MTFQAEKVTKCCHAQVSERVARKKTWVWGTSEPESIHHLARGEKDNTFVRRQLLFLRCHLGTSKLWKMRMLAVVS